MPVTLDNDINLAAIGEQWRGIARGVDDFAFLSIGTGLGPGLVLDGELHRGRNGAAGEVDYGLVGFGVELDPCAAAVSRARRRLVAREGTATMLVAAVRAARGLCGGARAATRPRRRSSPR